MYEGAVKMGRKGQLLSRCWRDGFRRLSQSSVVWILVPDSGCVVCNLQGSQPQGPRSRPASRRSRSRSFRRRPPPHRPIYYSEVINQLERVTFLPRRCGQNILLNFRISWLFFREIMDTHGRGYDAPAHVPLVALALWQCWSYQPNTLKMTCGVFTSFLTCQLSRGHLGLTALRSLISHVWSLTSASESPWGLLHPGGLLDAWYGEL